MYHINTYLVHQCERVTRNCRIDMSAKICNFLQKWLVLYFEDDFLEPTFRVLIDAVAHDVGGSDRQLAETMAIESHKLM